MKYYAIILTVLSLAATISTETHSKYEPVCRDTVPSGDFDNNTVRMDAMRKAITDYWNSEAVPKDLSSNANLLIEKVLARNETDSYQQLSTMYDFTLVSSLYFVLAEDTPGLCFLAETINASTTWSESKDGRLALKTINNGVEQRLGWCLASISSSLERNGCKQLPHFNVRSQSNCYAKGSYYDLEKTLKYYGKDLPCSFVDLINTLYHSENYYDNLLAATFVSTLTELSDDISSSHHVDVQIELLNSVIDPKDKICCCKRRRERFTYLCEHFAKTDMASAIEKYANTECPPGAAYLK